MCVLSYIAIHTIDISFFTFIYLDDFTMQPTSIVYVNVCAFLFSSVEIPRGGFAHLWCLVFSGHPDVSHHMAAGKVSILQARNEKVQCVAQWPAHCVGGLTLKNCFSASVISGVILGAEQRGTLYICSSMFILRSEVKCVFCIQLLSMGFYIFLP